MCPPASIGPATELGEYWTDEAVFKFLMQLKSGCSLPSNILTNEDPYQSTPSSIHEMWCFWSGTKRDAENGFWRSTGEACEIYSNSGVTGFRKTLEFYKGQAPHGEKTNWLMQEYTTTDKYNSKLDPRALYRVFLVDNDTSNGQLPKSQLLEKNMDDVAGPSAIDKNLEDCVSKGDYLELDDLDIPPSRTTSLPDLGEYVSRGGDYLEMNDLVIPLSRTTSSTDSSCMTMTSEEYFDSEALMREIGDDNGVHEIQESKIQLNLLVPAKLKEVVMQPTTLGSLDSGENHKPSTGQTSGPAPEDHRNTSTSSSSSEGSSKDEKKDGSKKRKMMKYLCFLAF